MRRILFALLGLVVILGAIAFLLPSLISVDSYRGRIEAAAEAATGRKLVIKGPLKLDILPQLAFSARDVTMANAAGSAQPQMIALKRLVLELQLMPLIHGRIAVDRFILERPEIELEIDKSGRPNWQLSKIEAAAGGTPALAPAASSNAGGNSYVSLSDIRLGKVKIEDGRITYRDSRTGQIAKLDKINLTLKLPDLDGPYTAEGALAWAGETVALTVEGKAFGKLMAGTPSAVSAKLAARPINIVMDGSVTNGKALSLNGKMKLDVPSLRSLAAWLGQPISGGGTGFGALSVAGNVALSGNKLALTEAKLTIDDMKGSGQVAIDAEGVKPRIDAKLDLDKLDANLYLAPQSKARLLGPAGPGTGAPAPAPDAPAADWSDDPIDISALNLFDGDFAISAGAVDFRTLHLGKSRVEAKLKDGTLTANFPDATLYGGKGHGRLEVDGRGATTGLKLSGSVDGIDVQALLKDLSGDDKISGKASGDLDVVASGRTQRGLIQALNGKGKLAVRDGVYKGVDLGGLVGKVAGGVGNLGNNLLGSKGGGGGETKFTAVTGSFNIKNGLLSNNDLDLNSSVLRATGAGTADMPKRTVNYKLQTKLLAGIAVPVNVTGPWDNPSYEPDLSGLAVGNAKGLVNGASGMVKDAAGILKGGATPNTPGATSSPSSTSAPATSAPANLLKKLF